MTRTGSYKFTSPSSSIYIISVVWGGGESGCANWSVPGGGELVAVVERGVTWYNNTSYLAAGSGGLPYNSTDGYHMAVPSGSQYVQYATQVSVPAGSMVDVRHHTEATAHSSQPLNTNQRLGSGVYQGTAQNSTGGVEFNKKMQNGITWGEHHSTLSKAGGNYYTNAITGWFNAIMYTYGTWSGKPLKIEHPSYSNFVVEVRPGASASNFYQDVNANTTSLTSTAQVLYSVGPMDISPGQVVEVRYQAAFTPNAGQTTIVHRIVRATSNNATTGTTVQANLAHALHGNYGNVAITNSTADRNLTSNTLYGQYYNVVAYRIYGSSTVPVTSWGEMEAVKR